MNLRGRDHVRALTGLLSAISLGLVFGTVGGIVPGNALPRAPDAFLAAIPTLNAVISLVAIGTIAFGWRAIRRGHVARHRALMAVSLALFAGFLALYLYRIAIEGPTAFPGPGIVYRFVYLPVLAVHITLAIVCVPLLYYVFLLAITRPVREVPLTRHPWIGRIAASLWLVSFSLGVVVYGMLYVFY